MVVLMAILIPALAAAKKAAKRAANTAILSTLQSALQTYYGDFNAYPASHDDNPILNPYRPPFNNSGAMNVHRGSAMLAQGLVGYLPGVYDGAGPSTNGPSSAAYASDSPEGFRPRNMVVGGIPQGRVYGPYVQKDPKTYHVNVHDTSADKYDEVFLDAYGHEIYYFVPIGTPAINGRIFTPLGAPPSAPVPSFFDSHDNLNDASGAPIVPSTDPSVVGNVGFFHLLGSTAPAANTYSGGTILGSDSFLLVSAGEDGAYFADAKDAGAPNVASTICRNVVVAKP